MYDKARTLCDEQTNQGYSEECCKDGHCHIEWVILEKNSVPGSYLGDAPLIWCPKIVIDALPSAHAQWIISKLARQEHLVERMAFFEGFDAAQQWVEDECPQPRHCYSGLPGRILPERIQVRRTTPPRTTG